MGIRILRGDVLSAAIFCAAVGCVGPIGPRRIVVDDAGRVRTISGSGGSGFVAVESGGASVGSLRSAGAAGVWKIILGWARFGDSRASRC